MSPPGARAALVPRVALVLGLLAAVTSLAGCADEEPVVTTPRPVVVSPNAPSVATALPDRPDRAIAQLVNVVFRDGVVAGDTGQVPVKLNSLVRLSVISDVSDVIVVEGYDQTVQTAIEQAVQLEILADQPGSFPVRLRDEGTVLATLVVR